jgi:AraC family transcriptional regulator
MIVTTEFPDLPPSAETTRNADFRRRFFSRWGRESSVFVAATRRVAIGPIPTALSFKTILNGSAALTLGRRRVLLEAGMFLVVNAGDEYCIHIDSPRKVHCFSVHFQPQLAGDVASSQGLNWRQALDSEVRPDAVPLFRENLCRLDPALLQFVARAVHAVQQGHADAMALEQQIIALLQVLLEGQARQRRELLAQMPALRPSTRLELLRRLDWAADFILSNYSEPICLDDIANAARLSKYHLLRAFHQVHRRTPHQFLRERRVEVARRLLDDSQLDLEAVASASGFGSRWSLQRALRLHLGATGARLREAAHA